MCATRNEREYMIWSLMKQRCRNPKNPGFHLYGGRGIKVCDRWMEYGNFLEDMGRSPTASHSIDRIDVNRNYEPANCRWATPREQATNRRDNVLITHNGETMCMKEWARKIGMSYPTLKDRIARGWSIKRAIEEPVAHKKEKPK